MIRALALLLTALAAPLTAQERLVPEVEGPAAVVGGNPFKLTVNLPGAPGPVPVVVRSARGELLAVDTLPPGGSEIPGLTVRSGADLPLLVATPAGAARYDATLLPGWTSVVPPLMAIALALIFKEVVISLFAGVWLGAFLWTGFNPLGSLLRSIDTFILPAISDPSNASILLFSMLIGGMVGVMAKNGGMHGVVEAIAGFASNRRRGLLATYLQGLVIFFDDYANTLIVGNTMRPVTDRLRVSREKLSYLVDSTSAPVASIAFVSTWVGYEISLISDGLATASERVAAADPDLSARLAEMSAFNVFLDSIPYRFYPLLALVLVFLIIWTGRDLGPMLTAERRAASGGGLSRPGASLMTDTESGAMEPVPGVAHRWINSAAPVMALVLTVLIGLYTSGRAALGPGEHPLRDIIGASDPFSTLLWGALIGCVVAIGMSLAQRLLSVQQAMEAWLGGLRAMVLAMVVLTLAWSLKEVTDALGTASYISTVLAGTIPATLLPVLVFAIAAGISFATGTSWGTMAILIPLVIPLGAALAVAQDLSAGGGYTILLGVTSSVLAGAIFGDHCSPISDTTVLSSTASACDHMDHVRTQLPYALLVAGVGMILGDIPTAFGVSPWLSLGLATLVLWGVLRLFGRPVEEQPPVTKAGEERAAAGAL